jgi:hypothetical protein
MKKATLYEVIPKLFENNNNHEIRCLKNVELRDLNIRNLHEIGLLTEKAISRNLEIF